MLGRNNVPSGEAAEGGFRLRHSVKKKKKKSFLWPGKRGERTPVGRRGRSGRKRITNSG